MAMIREEGQPPVRSDGKPLQYSYLFETQSYYLNYDRHVAMKRHRHIFKEAGLVLHVVCRECSLCRLRVEVPFFRKDIDDDDVSINDTMQPDN